MENYSDHKEVYRMQSGGNIWSYDVVILMKINREFTDIDKENINVIAEKLQHSMLEETYRINPQNSIDAKKEKEDILGLFGNNVIFVEEIPNGYCSRYCCKHLPWFVVTTKKGRIKIGWRKRVINIDWSDSVIKDKADVLFKEEEVTKEDKYIHAWGLEKAKECIDKLLK